MNDELDEVTATPAEPRDDAVEHRASLPCGQPSESGTPFERDRQRTLSLDPRGLGDGLERPPIERRAQPEGRVTVDEAPVEEDLPSWLHQ